MLKDYHSDNKSFVVYKEWEQYIRLLGSDEEAGKLFKAIFAFASRGEEPDFSGALGMAFAVIRNALERDGAKWEEACSRRSEAGKKGGRPPKAKKAEGFPEKQTEAEKADKENVNVKENDIDNVNVIVNEKDAPVDASETTTTINRYGNNVFMTSEEYASLAGAYGRTAVDEYIVRYDSYIRNKNVIPYSNSFPTLKRWMEKDGVPMKQEHSYDLDRLLEHAMTNVPVYGGE